MPNGIYNRKNSGGNEDEQETFEARNRSGSGIADGIVIVPDGNFCKRHCFCVGRRGWKLYRISRVFAARIFRFKLDLADLIVRTFELAVTT